MTQSLIARVRLTQPEPVDCQVKQFEVAASGSSNAGDATETQARRGRKHSSESIIQRRLN